MKGSQGEKPEFIKLCIKFYILYGILVVFGGEFLAYKSWLDFFAGRPSFNFGDKLLNLFFYLFLIIPTNFMVLFPATIFFLWIFKKLSILDIKKWFFIINATLAFITFIIQPANQIYWLVRHLF